VLPILYNQVFVFYDNYILLLATVAHFRWRPSPIILQESQSVYWHHPNPWPKINPLSQKTKDGIAVLKYPTAQRRVKRFFYVQNSALVMSGWAEQSQDWPVRWFRYCNFAQSGTHDCSRVAG